MTEGQQDAPDRPEAERYYAQHASLDAGEAGSSEAALQAAINEGAPELEAGKRDAGPDERRRHPGVGHVGVLLRLIGASGLFGRIFTDFFSKRRYHWWETLH
jgi:hypothetical protein